VKAAVLLALLLANCLTASAQEVAVRFAPRAEPGLSLEGLLQVPAAGHPVPGVVLCHPDPRYGGTLGSIVIAALQREFASAGWATLRFNFRGVGGSTGAFDGGSGERRDCLGALDLLRSAPGVDGSRVGLIGYSFGSWVGLQACVEDGHVLACGCVAFPVSATEDLSRHPYLAKLTCPTLFLTGTLDTISSLATIRALLDRYRPATSCLVQELEGADHFFGDPSLLQQATRAMLTFLTAQRPRPDADLAPQAPTPPADVAPTPAP
jgi:alpha/beta superfamily hydrolase